jgi:hypothetical protein
VEVYNPLNSPVAASSAFTALATVALTRCSTMRSTMASMPARPTPLLATAAALGLPGPRLTFLLPFGLPGFRCAIAASAAVATLPRRLRPLSVIHLSVIINTTLHSLSGNRQNALYHNTLT